MQTAVDCMSHAGSAAYERRAAQPYLAPALCTGMRLCPDARMLASVCSFRTASADSMNTCATRRLSGQVQRQPSALPARVHSSGPPCLLQRRHAGLGRLVRHVQGASYDRDLVRAQVAAQPCCARMDVHQRFELRPPEDSLRISTSSAQPSQHADSRRLQPPGSVLLLQTCFQGLVRQQAPCSPSAPCQGGSPGPS